MELHKCTRKNCPCGGSTDTRLFRKNTNKWYCPIAWEEVRKIHREAKAKRKNKPKSPTCRTILENGEFCGQPTHDRCNGVDCCKPHFDIKKQELLNKDQLWYETNKEYRKQYSKEYYAENRDRIISVKTIYNQNHKAENKLNGDINWGIKWLRNYLVMKILDPKFNFETFCDQQSRQFVINDFERVGLFIRNEHTLIRPDSLRQRRSIDCSIVSLGLYIETKSTEATFSEKETLQQVSEFKSLLDFEMANGYSREHKATFISWSPTGDNAEMSLREFYLFMKDKVKYEYKRLGREKFKKKFPAVRYMDLLRLCDKRVKQLSRAEKYNPKSSKYNHKELKQGLIEKLLSGEITIKRMDMNLLREKFGNK